jgi:hypothetical protein
MPGHNQTPATKQRNILEGIFPLCWRGFGSGYPLRTLKAQRVDRDVCTLLGRHLHLQHRGGVDKTPLMVWAYPILLILWDLCASPSGPDTSSHTPLYSSEDLAWASFLVIPQRAFCPSGQELLRG